MDIKIAVEQKKKKRGGQKFKDCFMALSGTISSQGVDVQR